MSLNLNIKHNDTNITNISSGSITLNTANKYSTDNLSFNLSGFEYWNGDVTKTVTEYDLGSSVDVLTNNFYVSDPSYLNASCSDGIMSFEATSTDQVSAFSKDLSQSTVCYEFDYCGTGYGKDPETICWWESYFRIQGTQGNMMFFPYDGEIAYSSQAPEYLITYPSGYGKMRTVIGVGDFYKGGCNVIYEGPAVPINEWCVIKFAKINNSGLWGAYLNNHLLATQVIGNATGIRMHPLQGWFQSYSHPKFKKIRITTIEE